MTTQLEFDLGGPYPPRPRKPERLIFMLLLEVASAASAVGVASGLLDQYGIQAKLLRYGRLHISLHLVGDFRRLRDKFIFAASRAADSIKLQPFEVCFDHVVTFPHSRPGNRATVLLGGSPELVDLQRHLADAMIRNGLKANLGFNPHVTLFYSGLAVPLQRVRPVRFVIKDFLLVHSELWLSKYNILSRWT